MKDRDGVRGTQCSTCLAGTAIRCEPRSPLPEDQYCVPRSPDFIASSEFKKGMRMNLTVAAAGRSFLSEAGRRIFGRDVGKRIE